MLERGFYWSNKSCYKHVVKTSRILFGIYDTEGGTTGEMEVEWIEIGGRNNRKLVPKLGIFSDALKVLASFTDLIQEMAKLPEDYTQEEFVEVLKKCEFKDLTEY